MSGNIRLMKKTKTPYDRVGGGGVWQRIGVESELGKSCTKVDPS